MIQTITYDDTLYQLVPIKPSSEMIERMRDQNMAGSMDNWNAYSAALSAAPTPPAQPAERKPPT